MGLGDFVNICKDIFMLMISAMSTGIGSLFSMPLFGTISVGHILLGFLAFGIIFGFLFSFIIGKFSDDWKCNI